jgi:hypothetical protein
MNSPVLAYAAVGAGFLGVGYLIGRITSGARAKIAEFKRDETVAKEKVSQLDLETKVRLKELEYQNADSDHKRKLELIDKERAYKLEDSAREDQKEEQKALRAKEETEKNKQYRIELANKLIELKPVLESYLQELRNLPAPDPEYIKLREEYRQELVLKVMEKYEAGEGYAHEITENEEDPFDSDVVERIEHAVDAKFPLPSRRSPEIPYQIGKLVSLI